MNFYGFTGNRVVNALDRLGLETTKELDWDAQGVDFLLVYRSFEDVTVEELQNSIPLFSSEATGGTAITDWELDYSLNSEDCPPDCYKFKVTSAVARGLIGWTPSDGRRNERHEMVHLEDQKKVFEEYVLHINKVAANAGCVKPEKGSCYIEAFYTSLNKHYRIKSALVAAKRHTSTNALMRYPEGKRYNPKTRRRDLPSPFERAENSITGLQNNMLAARVEFENAITNCRELP